MNEPESTAMKPIISYLRVSTSQQERSGLGIEGQRTAVERFAASNGYEIIAEFVETETGKGHDALDRRPVLAKALAAAKKVKCAVVVAKLDRLSRSVAFVSRLMSEKVAFIVAELGEHVDAFMLHVYVAVAQKEREMIAERTRSALAAKKAQGALLGNRKNLAEAQKLGAESNRDGADRFAEGVLPIVRPMHEQGRSLNAISRYLNTHGVRSARGGSWTAKSVANVLARAA
jgi:DNA invertase Pin-like site-specific DNA recombinase